MLVTIIKVTEKEKESLEHGVAFTIHKKYRDNDNTKKIDDDEKTKIQ